jgi:redox-sensitive bicupin YhaK (pirin superfamily)
VLLLAAEPLGEPIARMGPFVMNTRRELEAAYEDYINGRMGAIGAKQI